jgi:hypothetical protein
MKIGDCPPLLGTFLKWGVTGTPDTRYPKSFMLDKRLTPVDYGPRKIMLQNERALIETNPGLLNFEPWAGVGQ